MRRRGLCSTDSLTEAMSSEVAKPSSSEDCFSPPSLHTIFRPPQFKGAKIGKEMVFALYITEWHTAYTSHFSGLFLHCHSLKHSQDTSLFFENKRKACKKSDAKPKIERKICCIVLCVKKQTKLYSKIVLVKSSGNNFIFVLVFHLIMCFMKAQKNFVKITILKIWELVSLGGVKIHFGKLAMKWCIFRHDKKLF